MNGLCTGDTGHSVGILTPSSLSRKGTEGERQEKYEKGKRGKKEEKRQIWAEDKQ